MNNDMEVKVTLTETQIKRAIAEYISNRMDGYKNHEITFMPHPTTSGDDSITAVAIMLPISDRER